MKPLICNLLLASALAGVAATSVSLVTSPVIAARALDEIGPAVGSRVKLTNGRVLDQAGKPTTLARIAGGKPMMVVAFRSAAWCPYCQRQLKALGPVAEAARKKGVKLIAVSYDTPETLTGFAKKNTLSFPLYSDGGGRMFQALGLRDPQYPEGNFAYGVPYPTILMFDAKGRVTAKSVETDYRIRPSQADIIAMMGQG